MATDIATLGLDVDTTRLNRGRRDVDDFTNATKKAEGASRSFGESIRTAFETLAVAEVMKKIVTSSVALETQTKLLTTALKNNGQQLGLTVGELEDYAKGMENVTNFSDKAFLSAQRTFIQMGGVSKQTLPELTKAAADLATQFEMDLPEAARMLARAIKDPEQGLMMLNRTTRLFTKEQKDGIKALVEMGHEAEAQTYVMQRVEKAFGGAAEAAHDGLGGALASLRNEFEHLMENKDGIPGTKAAMEDLGRAMKDPDVIGGFNTLTTSVITLVGWLSKLIAEAALLPKNLGENVAAMQAGVQNDRPNVLPSWMGPAAWATNTVNRMMNPAPELGDVSSFSISSGFQGIPYAPKAQFSGISDYLKGVTAQNDEKPKPAPRSEYFTAEPGTASDNVALPVDDGHGNLKEQTAKAASMATELSKVDADFKAKSAYLKQYGIDLQGTKTATLEAAIAEKEFSKLGPETIAVLRAKAEAADKDADSYKQLQLVTADAETMRKEHEQLDNMRQSVDLLGQSAEAVDKFNYASQQRIALMTRTKGMHAEEAEAARKATEALIAEHDALVDLRHESETSFATGLTQSITDYTAAVNDSATQTKKVFQDATGGMTDALLQFVQTGKLSFTNLANSIIMDMERIAIEKMVLGLVEMLGGNYASANSSGGGYTSAAGTGADTGFTYSEPTYVKKASGGYISGAGSSTSDSIPAMISNGEYVIQASSVQKYGKSFFDALNSGRGRGFASGGYAGQPNGAGVAGGPITVTVTNYVNAQNATDPAEIARAMEVTRQRTLADIRELQTRGRFG
jgi:lambda family phage tail tape measure protein